MLKYSKYEGFQTEAEKLEEEQNPSRNNNNQTNKLDDMGSGNEEVMTGGGKKRRKSKKRTRKSKRKTRKSKRNLKKHNKSKRKYKKKGAGPALSTRRHTPPPPPQRVIGNPDNLPLAEAILHSIPVASVSPRSVTNIEEPYLTIHSDERILTVKILMDEMNFNDLKNDHIRDLVKDALLNYVHHEDYSIYSVKQPRNVEDSYKKKKTYYNNELVDERQVFVPGELRIFLSEWEQSKMLHDKDENEAVLDLIQRLKSPANEDIKFYDLYDR